MLIDNYPKETLDCLMNILGTHDTPRILTVMGNRQCADKEEMSRTRLSDEEKTRAKALVRMAAVLQYTLPGVPCVFYGDEAGLEGYMDPFCRACFPWDQMDESLCAFYRLLGEIRTKRIPEAFRDGEYREIYADTRCLIFERKSAHTSAYVFCNNSATRYSLKFRSDGRYKEFLSGEESTERLEIGPFSYGIVGKIDEK